MPAIVHWDRFVRYVSADGQVRFGEPKIENTATDDIIELAEAGKLTVEVLQGDGPLTSKRTGKEDRVAKLLRPLTPKDVPYIRCIGLNYKTHSKQSELVVEILTNDR
jgi:hypothetical protein